VRFEWSPGRWLTGQYLENRSAFDVAFELELEGGGLGLLGVETKYHEHCKAEKAPSEERRQRYALVTGDSGVLSEASMKAILGTDLQQLWLDHLLSLSMLEHGAQRWQWVGFALVHPAENPSYARAASRYQDLLERDHVIRVSTLESLLDADVLAPGAGARFAKRYLW
jgi:hypothetical protein